MISHTSKDNMKSWHHARCTYTDHHWHWFGLDWWILFLEGQVSRHWTSLHSVGVVAAVSSLQQKWSLQSSLHNYWWWRWGDYKCFYALQLNFKPPRCFYTHLQVLDDAMHIFSMHFKSSTDAILILLNSSLIHFRCNMDTFHAVFALEFPPCTSNSSSMHFSANKSSMHFRLQFHAFQCSSMQHIKFPVPCISVQIFYAPQIPVPCISVHMFHAAHQTPVQCILHQHASSMHFWWSTAWYQRWECMRMICWHLHTIHAGSMQCASSIQDHLLVLAEPFLGIPSMQSCKDEQLCSLMVQAMCTCTYKLSYVYVPPCNKYKTAPTRFM